MLGVVIVAYNSADVIADCLESIVGAPEITRIVVVDNQSTDHTCATIRDWASRAGIMIEAIDRDGGGPLLERLLLVPSGLNRGFAGAVNLGLAVLKREPGIQAFWILNPDAAARPHTPSAILDCARRHPEFGLMGGRIVYTAPGNRVQADGGRYSRWTGICESINQGKSIEDAIVPDAATLDFVTGAHMIASRRFVEEVGPMNESYFLYYEEVDWAARRGGHPIVRCDRAEVVHQGGTSIGTAVSGRRASPLSHYFNFRNRIRFMRRFHPFSLPMAYGNAVLRVLKIARSGDRAGAVAALRGTLGLAPPAEVARLVAPEARPLAFGRTPADVVSIWRR